MIGMRPYSFNGLGPMLKDVLFTIVYGKFTFTCYKQGCW